MKKIFLTFLLLTFNLGLFAQVNDELKSLINDAFSHYPKLKELDALNEINAIKINIAESNYLPNINGTASYTYVDPVGQATFPVSATETRSIQFQPHNNYNLNVGLNQLIYDFGRTKAQVDKAKADLESSQFTNEAARQQLASQVVNIYYSVIYLQKAIALQDSVLSFYSANRKLVQSKIDQGDALKVDLINIDNSISQEKNRKLDFERQVKKQLALMEYTTGQSDVPAEQDFNFTVDLDADGPLDENAELKSISAKVSSAEADAKFAQHNRLPNLSLQAGAGFRNGYQPDIDEVRFNYLAGLSLNIPIFQGNRIKQNIQVAQKSVALNLASRENLQAILTKDFQSAYADYTAFLEQQTNAQAQIEASKEALRLTQVRYDRGVATYVDLVFASTNYQRSLLSLLQLKYQSVLAQGEMARIMGVRFWE